MYISAEKGLALVRVWFGVYYLAYALDKTLNGWLTSAGPMTNFLFGNPNATPPTRGVIANSAPIYADFLTGVVQPNAQLFSQLVVIGEFVAGALLLLGLLTRFGASVGIFLNLNFWLMKGLIAHGAWVDRLFVLSLAVLLLAAAGLVWGLDGRLRSSLSGNGVTRWLAGLNGSASDGEPVPVRA